MLIKLFKKIKKILPLAAIVFFLIIIIIDFNKFNFDKRQFFLNQIKGSIIDSENIIISGNHYIPYDVVIKMIDNNEYDIQYSLLVDDLKIITTSNSSKLAIISEHFPLFYDKNYIYLSSGEKIEYSLDLFGKEKIASLDIDRLNSNNKIYSKSVKRLSGFINYLKNDYSEFYDKLEKVDYNSIRGDKSPHVSLSVFINGCKVLLSDESGEMISLQQKDFEYKINILNNLLSQHHKNIEEISEVDLRYDNYAIFFNLKDEGVDG